MSSISGLPPYSNSLPASQESLAKMPEQPNMAGSYGKRLKWGDNALTAPHSPAHRLSPVDRSKVDPKVLQAAEGMEGMFLDYMMKVMRETVPKSEMDVEGPGTAIYQGMMDSETAQRAAHAGGVGLADQIIAYMQQQQYTGKREHAAPQNSQPAASGATPEETGKAGQSLAVARTGGTHEGHTVSK
ncbi:MAG: rod-binding protein [Methylotenera sp.]|nr:rod-binding protein [Oligoflexia bacterium]